MGFGGSADIFQAQMMGLMASLDYVQAYIDDLLIITRGTKEDHDSAYSFVQCWTKGECRYDHGSEFNMHFEHLCDSYTADIYTTRFYLLILLIYLSLYQRYIQTVAAPCHRL